jgi:hypothetical protein
MLQRASMECLVVGSCLDIHRDKHLPCTVEVSNTFKGISICLVQSWSATFRVGDFKNATTNKEIKEMIKGQQSVALFNRQSGLQLVPLQLMETTARERECCDSGTIAKLLYVMQHHSHPKQNCKQGELSTYGQCIYFR